MADLLTAEDLPVGFEYPAEFVRLVELGLTNLEPWWIVNGELLRQRFLGLADRYPNRHLVPFAVRQDCDDVACWDAAQSGKVVIVHDFADPGFEVRGEFASTYAWLRQAIEDLIEWT